MSGDDLPIKVYEGEPSDVAFLISLLAGINEMLPDESRVTLG